MDKRGQALLAFQLANLLIKVLNLVQNVFSNLFALSGHIDAFVGIFFLDLVNQFILIILKHSINRIKYFFFTLVELLVDIVWQSPNVAWQFLISFIVILKLYYVRITDLFRLVQSFLKIGVGRFLLASIMLFGVLDHTRGTQRHQTILYDKMQNYYQCRNWSKIKWDDRRRKFSCDRMYYWAKAKWHSDYCQRKRWRQMKKS